jgi:MoaA/NifB/PqqE/SkfB family radical SAM enzyme
VKKKARTLEFKNLDKIKGAVEEAQNQGNYPQKFNMPLAVQFELTSLCNLRCLHCYNRSAESDQKTLMQLENWLNVCNDIVDNGGVFQCILSGGEPLLLGDNLLNIMDTLHKDNTGFVLITNGYLVDEEWVKKLAKYRYYWVQVSIDGSEEKEHDDFRMVNGSWRKAVNAAYLFSKQGLPLVIASSVTPKNLDKIEDMVKLAFNLGASSIILGKIMASGRAVHNKEILLNDEQNEFMHKRITELRGKYGDKIQIQTGSDVEYQLKNSSIFPTRAVIVRPDGNVRLDCVAPFVIGNVLETKFSDIWKSKAENCWKHPKVVEYIESFSGQEETESSIINYIDEDILI